MTLEIDKFVFYFINQPTGIKILDIVYDYMMIFFTSLGNGFITIPLVGLIVYLIDKKNFKYEFITFIIILLIGGIVVQVLKSLFNTPRPLKILEDVRVLLDPLHERGFPSGHTQAAFTASTFLYHKLKKYSLILFGVSFLVGISRIYVGAHFPSDVIGGTIIGMIVPLPILHFKDKLFKGQKFKKLVLTKEIKRKVYEKICFFHMNQIGDLMFSFPILYATKMNFHRSTIYCIVRPHLAEILKSANYVDQVLIRDYPISSLFHLVRVANEIEFDVIVFFSESISAFIFARLCNAKEKIGFDSFPLSITLTKKIKKSSVPSIENNKKLGNLLGLKNIPEDYVGLLNIKREINEKHNKMVIIAPFASKRREYKSYPVELTATLIRLIKKINYEPILIGDKGNIEKSKKIEELSGVEFQNLVGKTSLSEVCDLLIQSRRVICVDSGIMHLAASLGKNVVALFGGTVPELVGPRPLGNHTIIKKQKVSEISPEEIISYINVSHQ